MYLKGDQIRQLQLLLQKENWKEKLNDINGLMKEWGLARPELMKGFEQLAASCGGYSSKEIYWFKDSIMSIWSNPIVIKKVKEIIPSVEHVECLPKIEDQLVIDREFHIDVIISYANGVSKGMQFKVLSPHYSKYGTFTVEFYQNHRTKEKGEFFHCFAELWFHGYFNSDYTALCNQWDLIKFLEYREYLTNKHTISELEAQTRSGQHSTASFFHIEYSRIPVDYRLRNRSNQP